jgi:FemAB-related protein (PEP-CTERM system-associated)
MVSAQMKRLAQMATSELSIPVKAHPEGSLAEPVRVVPLSTSDSEGWDAFVKTHPCGTFFHQLGWKRVIEATYGYESCYLCAKRGDCITGIAPAFIVSSWLTGACLISLPFAVYGGVCAADVESEDALISRLEQLALDARARYIELRTRETPLRPAYHPNARYATFTLPLEADVEAIYKGLPKDVRYMIRKAEKAGLRAQRGFDQLDLFYDLITINLRRLGTPAFSRRLFENLIREYPGQVDITIVYSGDEPVAGGMSFFFRDWMQPYYIGSKEKAKALAGNDFLWWQLIKLAATTGFRVFDFGRSKTQSGNYDFKKKWNPRIEPLNYQLRLITSKSIPEFRQSDRKFQMASKVWSTIPLGLTKVIGPRVVRWFP